MRQPEDYFLKSQSSNCSSICRCINRHVSIGGIKNSRAFSPSDQLQWALGGDPDRRLTGCRGRFATRPADGPER